MEDNIKTGYYVMGGVFPNTDFKIEDLGFELIEVHGPYDTREEAEVAWRGYMFAQVDNALHRLFIVKTTYFKWW